MPMPTYTVYCYQRGCPHVAEYKIAARWSDGVTSELKTYGLVCEACLPPWFRQSLAKQAACRRAPKEILEPPGIYRLQRGARDLQLDRLHELEEQLLARVTQP
jgi:hypothetical protein